MATSGSVARTRALPLSATAITTSVSNASAAGSTTLEAGRDLQLQTVTVGSTNSVVADARNHRHSRSQQEIGSDIASRGDISIQAGKDVAARAASVQAGGDLNVQAGQDIKLEAGRAQSHSASSLYIKRSVARLQGSRPDVAPASVDTLGKLLAMEEGHPVPTARR